MGETGDGEIGDIVTVTLALAVPDFTIYQLK